MAGHVKDRWISVCLFMILVGGIYVQSFTHVQSSPHEEDIIQFCLFNTVGNETQPSIAYLTPKDEYIISYTAEDIHNDTYDISLRALVDPCDVRSLSLEYKWNSSQWMASSRVFDADGDHVVVFTYAHTEISNSLFMSFSPQLQYQNESWLIEKGDWGPLRFHLEFSNMAKQGDVHYIVYTKMQTAGSPHPSHSLNLASSTDMKNWTSSVLSEYFLIEQLSILSCSYEEFILSSVYPNGVESHITRLLKEDGKWTIQEITTINGQSPNILHLSNDTFCIVNTQGVWMSDDLSNWAHVLNRPYRQPSAVEMPDGRLMVAYVSNENGNDDIWVDVLDLRTQVSDGETSRSLLAGSEVWVMVAGAATPFVVGVAYFLHRHKKRGDKEKRDGSTEGGQVLNEGKR